MANNTKSRVMSGLVWRFAERCGAQGIQFVVSVVLARILSPSDYGMIGLLTVFIAISNVFINSGFGQALVQKKNADKLDFSSVFYFSIGMSLFIYALLFFTAPMIANFYNEAALKNVIRVLAVTVIIGAVNGVQQAYVQRTMQFKRFFFATLFGTILSAFTGIFAALQGWGVWALVIQQLTNQIFDTIVLWVTVKWRPILAFSLKRMKKMFSFGWKLLCSSLLDTVYGNIYSLIIGKFFSPTDLGYYNRGKQYPMLVIQNVNESINSVIFPVLSEAQDDKVRFKSMVRRAIMTSTFLIFPAMAGLAAVSKPLVHIMLTDKWLPAVPFIQFCCFVYAFWPIHTANLQAIKAIGRSDIFLKLEILKKIIGIAVLIITLPHGLMIMMWARCGTTIISSILNAYPNKKLINYSYWEQIKDMSPSLCLSLVMAVCVWAITLLPLSAPVQIIVQFIVGVVLYFGLAKLFKLECLDYVVNTVKGFNINKCLLNK